MSTLHTDASNALRYLHEPGSVFEICIIGPETPKGPWEGWARGKKALVVGYYIDPETAAKAALKVKATGIYTTLNPCKEAIHARAENRLKVCQERTADSHIARIKNLLVDVDADPGGVSGVSSTDAEHDAALDMAQVIQADLAEAGWPEPMVGDSGNGAHLVFSLDLENTPPNVELIKKVLQALARRYEDELGRRNLAVDTAVFNPARLTKLYGTMTRKGDNTKARPHRVAKLISLPEQRTTVSPDLLEELAATIPAEEKPQGKTTGSGTGYLDVRAYLEFYDREIVKVNRTAAAPSTVSKRACLIPATRGTMRLLARRRTGWSFISAFIKPARDGPGPRPGR